MKTLPDFVGALRLTHAYACGQLDALYGQPYRDNYGYSKQEQEAYKAGYSCPAEMQPRMRRRTG